MEEQDDVSYKHFHGMLMEHNNGTTLAETVMVLIPVPLGVLLIGLILHILVLYRQQLSLKLWVQFLIEFFLLVLPLQINLTIFSGFVYVLVVLLGLVCLILLVPTIKNIWSAGSMLWSIPIKETRRAYITNFRSSVNLITSLCMLAVDFTIFPRRFAKTESFGFSLMDIGVGGFIFTNAIVAPEAHRFSTDAPFRAILKAIVGSLPLTVLGIVRLVATQLLDYYVNVTEYGVEWNFFFTLAVCKVMCTVLLSVLPAKYSAVLSFLVICLHEILLASGIQDWVLSTAPRNNFFSANREGIISCSGYIALYLAGIQVGRLLHSKRVFFRDYLQLAVELLSASWLLSFVGEIVQSYLGVSRRLANFGYFILTVAYNLTFLTAFLLAELVIIVFEYNANRKIDKKTEEDKQVNQITFVPAILASVSYNGLFFFLIANLFTGFVNLHVRTAYVPVLGSILILTLYSFLLCSIIVILHVKQIQFKLW